MLLSPPNQPSEAGHSSRCYAAAVHSCILQTADVVVGTSWYGDMQHAVDRTRRICRRSRKQQIIDCRCGSATIHTEQGSRRPCVCTTVLREGLRRGGPEVRGVLLVSSVCEPQGPLSTPPPSPQTPPVHFFFLPHLSRRPPSSLLERRQKVRGERGRIAQSRRRC